MNRVDNSGAKLWIAMTRPIRLPIALAAAQKLYDRFPGGLHLLREHSNWWEHGNWKPFASEFRSRHVFDRVATCRGLRDLSRLYRESRERQSRLSALPINRDIDVILCFGGTVTLANALVSAHPDVFKILCISSKAYQDLTATGDAWHFRFTTSGWLQNRIIEPRVGLERTLDFKPWINPGGDGVRLVRLQRTPAEIYDAVIVLSNSGHELRKDAPGNVIAAKFPSIGDLRAISEKIASEQDRRRRVIFFGTPFLLIHNLPPDVYIKHLDLCLDYIRRHYGGDRDLIYRPHPAERNEAARLNLDGFEIEDDREVAELYFLRHFESIDAVFSVSSTVSRTALNNGFNAYCLWRCFPFPQSSASFFEKVMGEVPPEFDIRDLSRPPIPYADRATSHDDALSFSAALESALEMRRREAIPQSARN
jgi:hypothetical protein